jgi:hypothetical protein
MMYLYTEFPDIGIYRILWYFLREHNYEIVKLTLPIMKNNQQY